MPIIKPKPRQILYFKDLSGKQPAKQWLDKLKDLKAKVKIMTKLLKVEEDGALGTYKDLKKGLYEFKYDIGPGYRLYFTLSEFGELIVLLVGGTKQTQQRDIKKAREYLEEYKQNPEQTEEGEDE